MERSVRVFLRFQYQWHFSQLYFGFAKLARLPRALASHWASCSLQISLHIYFVFTPLTKWFILTWTLLINFNLNSKYSKIRMASLTRQVSTDNNTLYTEPRAARLLETMIFTAARWTLTLSSLGKSKWSDLGSAPYSCWRFFARLDLQPILTGSCHQKIKS